MCRCIFWCICGRRRTSHSSIWITLEIFFLNWLLYEKPCLSQVWEFILFHFLSLSLRLELWTSGSQKNFKMKTALLHGGWRMFAHVLCLTFPRAELGLPRWRWRWRTHCQCRKHKKHGVNPWVRRVPLEKGMAAHSHILAWKIPWTEEPGGYSHGKMRVSHDWSDLCMCFYVMFPHREVPFLQPLSVS